MQIIQDTNGRRYSAIMYDAVREVSRLCIRDAEFSPRVTQGGHNRGAVLASGGTHNGDAVDWAQPATLAQTQFLVSTARRVGLAAWFRTTGTPKWGTRAQGFASYHIHAVPNGWGVPSEGAIKQAVAYRNGRDGLIRNMLDAGPGHVSNYRQQTWMSYVGTTPKEGTIMSKKVVVEGISEWFDIPRRAGGELKSFIQHILDDQVMGKARSVALHKLQQDVNALNHKLGVTAEENREAFAAMFAGFAEDVSAAAADAIQAHRPAIERAEAVDIAHTVIEMLAEKLNNG